MVVTQLGFFAQLRESRPVARVQMPNYGPTWIVTRYADVRAPGRPATGEGRTPVAGREPVPAE